MLPRVSIGRLCFHARLLLPLAVLSAGSGCKDPRTNVDQGGLPSLRQPASGTPSAGTASPSAALLASAAPRPAPASADSSARTEVSAPSVGLAELFADKLREGDKKLVRQSPLGLQQAMPPVFYRPGLDWDASDVAANTTISKGTDCVGMNARGGEFSPSTYHYTLKNLAHYCLRKQVTFKDLKPASVAGFPASLERQEVETPDGVHAAYGMAIQLKGKQLVVLAVASHKKDDEAGLARVGAVLRSLSLTKD